MASKIFVDANCLLDLTLQRANFHHMEVLVQLSIAGELRLHTTPGVLHIVSYYTGKFYGKDVAKQVILALLNDLQIIDCIHETVITAAASNFADPEDALQYYTALYHGMDYFISADKQLKKNALSQLPVYSSKDLLAVIA